MPRDLAYEARVEREQEVAVLMLNSATTPTERRKAWNLLKYWKAQRSPEKVLELERDKGIAP